MATTCESLIAQDIIIPCDDIVSKGLESDGVIINRRDIDFAATQFSVENKNIIEQLVLKTGKKGYSILQEGNNPFTGTKTELEVGTYINKWSTEIPILVLSNTPDVCANIIDGLANGRFVVILRNNTKGADGKAEYQVFGYEQGLVCSAGTNEKYSDDTEGGWLITLKEEKARKSAMFFYKTSSQATAAAYESLKSEAK